MKTPHEIRTLTIIFLHPKKKKKSLLQSHQQRTSLVLRPNQNNLKNKTKTRLPNQSRIPSAHALDATSLMEIQCTLFQDLIKRNCLLPLDDLKVQAFRLSARSFYLLFQEWDSTLELKHRKSDLDICKLA